MSRLDAQLKRKIVISDENAVGFKTPMKQTLKTPMKPLNDSNALNTPAFGKSAIQTPGLSVRSSNVINTPRPKIQKPAFDIFKDDFLEESFSEPRKLVNSSVSPRKLVDFDDDVDMVDFNADEDIDYCVGKPIYDFYEDDYNWLKEIDPVELVDCEDTIDDFDSGLSLNDGDYPEFEFDIPVSDAEESDVSYDDSSSDEC